MSRNRNARHRGQRTNRGCTCAASSAAFGTGDVGSVGVVGGVGSEGSGPVAGPRTLGAVTRAVPSALRSIVAIERLQVSPLETAYPVIRPVSALLWARPRTRSLYDAVSTWCVFWERVMAGEVSTGRRGACPVCKLSRLEPRELEPNLPALACPKCSGLFLAFDDFLRWQAGNPDAPPAFGSAPVTSIDTDTGVAKLCPGCGRFM